MSYKSAEQSIDDAFQVAKNNLEFVQTELQEGRLPPLASLHETCLKLCEAVLSSPSEFTKTIGMKFDTLLQEVEKISIGVEVLEQKLNERPKSPHQKGTKIYSQRAEEL